jgi:hypothetical protein
MEHPMIRTLIFGAIAGYVGKKLYDEGKLTEFKNDLVTRYNDAKTTIADKASEIEAETASTSPLVSSTSTINRPLPN